MNEKGKQASEWLSEVTKDQNLERIDDITLTPIAGLRRWFASRILNFGIQTGWYNTNTDRVVLGPPSPGLLDAIYITTESTVSTVSAASNTLTVPAGYAYKIIGLTSRNANRNCAMGCSFTPAGGTESYLSQGTGTYAQSGYWQILGGNYPGSASCNSAGTAALWAQAGDVITIYQPTFVAADTVAYIYVYEVYAVS